MSVNSADKIEINSGLLRISQILNSYVEKCTYLLLECAFYSRAKLISGSPLPLLTLVKTVDVDFSFRDVEELASTLKQTFGTGNSKQMVQLPRVPQLSSEEKERVRRITEVLQTEINVSARLESTAAAHLIVKVPGFNNMAITPQGYI